MDHGLPSGHMAMIAAVIKARLAQNHRCLYFNSEQMVVEQRSYLEEIGVDVAREVAGTNLVFTSHLSHLSADQTFDADRMITALEDTLSQTLRDGYAGLWSTGNIAWEFGPKRDFRQLRHYEKQLEEFLCTHEEMSAICLYHASDLHPAVMQIGHDMHPSFFMSQTHSLSNPDCSVQRQGRALTDRNFLIQFKQPLAAPMLIRAMRVDIQGEHLVLLRADGRLAALFLLEIVSAWEDLQT
jgi:MEDS: MEthanogen/methylotroph, DcmR Sensory domain